MADAAAEARRIAKIAAIFFISISLVVCGFELLQLAFRASLLHLAVSDVLGCIGEVGFVAPVFGVAAPAQAGLVVINLVFSAAVAPDGFAHDLPQKYLSYPQVSAERAV